MTRTLLIYPYFGRRRDRSRFRFPPLGPAYVAAALREAGHEVELLDCTFLDRDRALAAARASGAPVVGVYAMATLAHEALWFAERLRDRCELLVAGGPLPTCEPEGFRAAFDLVVRGEGEQTMVEIVATFAAGADPGAVSGVVRGVGARRQAPPDGTPQAALEGAPQAALEGAPQAGLEGTPQAVLEAAPRPFVRALDELAFPARDLLPNEAYVAFGRQAYGYAITTVMSTRGCPYACEFCSNVVFGDSYRERSAGNVLDEVEQTLALGYDRISFADDVFTLRRAHVLAFCDEVARRGLRFSGECLGRVDALDDELAACLRAAGCFRIFFGIESGSDATLALMNK
ncbi:MAG TPA: radical SAM protein, partial [Thermoleophilia bacterium]|nr:radical SAM protein [Thermoleophilia bacterium]